MTILGHIRRPACIAAVAIVNLALVASARASVMLTITDTNSALGVVGAPDSITVAGAPPADAFLFLPTFGNFSSLAVSGQTIPASAFNGAELSDVQLTGVDVGTPAGTTDTLTVTVTGGDFTTPGGSPLTVESTLSSSNLSVGASGSFTSSLLSGSFTNPFTDLLTIAGNGQSSQAGMTSGGNTAPTIQANSTGTFQLTNTLTGTFVQGQTGTFTATTQVLSPEPSSLMLGLSGGLLLLARRRRNAPPRIS